MAKKNKYGFYVEKAPKKEKLIMHGNMNEVPNPKKKVNKREEHNMNILMHMKGIKWSD